MPQTTINKQAQSPLTEQDKQIIARIIQRTPEEIHTIWIEAGITVWVQLTNSGRLAFDKDWFATRVTEEKASLEAQESLHKRNQILEAELNQACAEQGLTHGEIDYLMFSAKIYQGRELIGFVGFSRFGQMWSYSRRVSIPNKYAKNASAALAALVGVKQLSLTGGRC